MVNQLQKGERKMGQFKRKISNFKHRIVPGVMSGLLALSTIVTGAIPMLSTAKASEGVYTVENVSDRISYSEAFGGIDNSMDDWGTNIFTVSDPDGDTYWGVCASPNLATPTNGTDYYTWDEYTNDTVARVLYWSLGNGWDDENYGVLRDYSEDIRTIIAHHTVALALGNDDWNTMANGAQALGDESKIGFQLCMKLLNVAANISTGDWDCRVIHIKDPDHNCQNIALYDEWYNPPITLTGKVRFHKESAIPSISDNNNCYSLSGAEISVYSDYECTDLLDVLTTDEDGYTDYYSTSFLEGNSSTLYYKETKAPKGFLLNDEVYSITLDSEDSYTETITDMPGNDPVSLVLSKRTADGHGSGNTRLEGAEYTVKYYDTLSDTDPAQAGSTAKYTWIFKTDANGRISFRPDYLLSGSDGLITNSNGTLYVLPLGTITIQETKAPEGYLVNDTVYVAQTTLSNGIIRTTNLPTDDKAAQETPYESTVSLQKYTNNDGILATEPDAEFEVYLKSAGSYEEAPEEARQTVVTDKNGYAITKLLPYGTYVIHQTKGDNKYYLSEDKEVTINENGANYHVTLEDSAIKYYVKIVKKDIDTGNIIKISGAEFEIYDENGKKVSFESMTSDGMKVIDKFTTNEDGYVYTPDRLIKGEYTLIETKAPEGYLLDSAPLKFTVSEDTFETENDINVVIVEKSDKAVSGQLTVKKTGEKLNGWNVSDFEYKEENLSGAEYKLTAKDDIKTADNNGYAYRAGDTVKEFVTDETGKYVINGLPLGNYTLTEIKAPKGFVIATEPVDITLTYSGQTTPIVMDTKTIGNERQRMSVNVSKTDATTLIPLLNTVFALYADEDITDYNGNIIIKKGTMIEKQTTNALGKAAFKADLPLGKYIVKEIDSPTGYNNRFEYKTIDGTYKSQTIKVQTFSYNFENDHTEIIRTIMMDDTTGTHQGALSRNNKYAYTDHVYIENFYPGKAYTLKGAIVDKATGEVLKDINGNDVVSSVDFKAGKSSQMIDVPFNFDADLTGKSIVAVEELYQDGIKIYSHYDLENEDQTLNFAEIHTTATDSKTKTHTSAASADTVINDKVTYKNLMRGQYEIKGVVIDKNTGKKILDKDKKEITSSKKFTVNDSDGYVSVDFTLDSSSLSGKSIVIFETLYDENGNEIAQHEDLNSKEQAISFAEIHTTATDKNTGTHAGVVGSETTITDKVDYKGLVPGEKYLFTGVLMDQSTNEKYLDKNGKEVTVSKEFIPETESGVVNIDFVLDSSLLSGKTLVVFETVYSEKDNAKVNVASHHDISSKTQAVYFPEIHTTATIDNAKSINERGEVVLNDLVKYSNLPAGKYVLKGIVMDKDTNEKILDKDGNEITATKEFTVENPNGEVNVEFTFDSSLLGGKSVVIFENLYKNNVKIIGHADINNTDQTVEIIKTPKTGDSLHVYKYMNIMLAALTIMSVCHTARKRKIEK